MIRFAGEFGMTRRLHELGLLPGRSGGHRSAASSMGFSGRSENPNRGVRIVTMRREKNGKRVLMAKGSVTSKLEGPAIRSQSGFYKLMGRRHIGDMGLGSYPIFSTFQTGNLSSSIPIGVRHLDRDSIHQQIAIASGQAGWRLQRPKTFLSNFSSPGVNQTSAACLALSREIVEWATA